MLAIWKNVAGSPKFPQQLISSTKTNSTDVKTALKAAATECGTFYQSDLYANDARTAKLISKGVLNGGDESWPKGEPQRYFTVTTEKCVSVPQIQNFVKCEGAAFVLDNTGSNQAVVYTVNGVKISVPKGQAFHTDAEGAPLIQPVNGEYVITAADRTWTFKAQTPQTADSNAPCYDRPEVPTPNVHVSQWIDKEITCDSPLVSTERGITTTPYIWDESKKEYVLDEENSVTVIEKGTREKTAEEVEDCVVVVTPPTDTPETDTPPTDAPPVTTPEQPTAEKVVTVEKTEAVPTKADSDESLAYTGSEGTAALALLALALLGAGTFFLSRRKLRK